MEICEYVVRKIFEKHIDKLDNKEHILNVIKRKASKIYKLPNPKNAELLNAYRVMVNNKKIKSNANIENLFVTKKIRTLSGVAVVAVLTKPYNCPGSCIYCPTEKNMPKSYLSNEPAVMRAILSNFHPFRQVKMRIKSLSLSGHGTDKIELIIMGGTFSYLPKQYQTWFIKECFRACNKPAAKRKIKNKNYLSEKLKDIQKINEVSHNRIVGLTLETRPDYINENEIKRMRMLGATRVELGAQSVYNDVLKLNKRGHGRREIIEATRLLKEYGFKVCYHIMPNLPGSSFKKDLDMFCELFSNPGFRPDVLKIYPCVVLKRSLLYKWWKTGKYKPYSNKELVSLLMKIKTKIPRYVRITRLIRDISSTSIEEGNKIPNLRQVIKKKMADKGIKCKCIRCREIMGKHKNNLFFIKENEIKIFREDYNASLGREIFLSAEDKKRNNIYSLLRLRINNSDNFFKSPKTFAIIREVHTYGKLVPIGFDSKNFPQHIGIGKKMIFEAEKIAKIEYKAKVISVISGVGAREYYRKLGYRLNDGYMVKKLK